MTFAQAHALLIGVNRYDYAPQLNVPMTATDVLALADVLRDPHSGDYPLTQVTVLTDTAATQAGITTALTDLAHHTTADDTVLLCYSGHGHYDTQGTYGLMTSDTQLLSNTIVPGTALGHHDLLTLVRAIPARRVLLLFNACHAGVLSPTLTPADTFPGAAVPDATNAALLATGEGRIIITACRANQYAFVGTGNRTIFMHALIAGLQGAGTPDHSTVVTVFDLYTYLYTAVAAAVQQLPAWLHERYGNCQEPELTILKGVGPFVVAQPRGISPAPHPAMTADLPRAAAVREVDATTSQQHFAQIQQDVSTVVGRDWFGSRTTHGEVTITGGQVIGSVVGATSGSIHTTSYGQTAPHTPTPLSHTYTTLQQLMTQARAAGNQMLAEDLAVAVTYVEAAWTAAQSGNTLRQRTKVQAALPLLRDLATHHPDLPALIQRLESTLSAPTPGGAS